MHSFKAYFCIQALLLSVALLWFLRMALRLKPKARGLKFSKLSRLLQGDIGRQHLKVRTLVRSSCNHGSSRASGTSPLV